MSEKVLVSVFDKVAKLYSPVMTEVNQESAIRNFKIGAKQNAQISACPEDYELHLVGFWDDETGKAVCIWVINLFFFLKQKTFSRLNSFGTI